MDVLFVLVVFMQALVREAYDMLGLQTYFTSGPDTAAADDDDNDIDM